MRFLDDMPSTIDEQHDQRDAHVKHIDSNAAVARLCAKGLLSLALDERERELTHLGGEAGGA